MHKQERVHSVGSWEFCRLQVADSGDKWQTLGMQPAKRCMGEQSSGVMPALSRSKACTAQASMEAGQALRGRHCMHSVQSVQGTPGHQQAACPAQQSVGGLKPCPPAAAQSVPAWWSGNPAGLPSPAGASAGCRVLTEPVKK